VADCLYSVHDLEVVASDLDHPECVNVGPDGLAYAGGEAGQLFALDLKGAVRLLANTGGGIGGLCLDGAGNVYECNYGAPVVHRVTPTGAVTVYSRGTRDLPAIYPNYPVFDRHGNLYYSDSGELYRPSGRLYVVRPDGRTELLFGDHLHFPNGLAIDAEERWLYMIQSTAANILRFPLRDGEVGRPEIYVDLPGTVPDGLAFAQSGNLYVACYAPDVVLRVTPRRQVERVVADPWADRLNRPTNVAFVPGTGRLLIANLGGFTVVALDLPEEVGQPLNYPRF
jgi:gluconolactonase